MDPEGTEGNGEVTWRANFQKDQLQDVVDAMMDKDSGVEISDRKWMFKTYNNCFVGKNGSALNKGKEAVDWLVKHGHAADREDAVRVGNLMVARYARSTFFPETNGLVRRSFT